MQSSVLDCVNSPDDIKKLNNDQMNQLANEIRNLLIDVISANGGHLASNLGIVELTIAIHYVFDSPNDKIVWDVGHQAYTHKIITGRKDVFNTIRTAQGISGFPNPDESIHDQFITGHSSSSISLALGLAKGITGNNGDSHVVAVIGDGSFTGGLAYEGLNNAGRDNDKIIIIINDNKESISNNVGGFAAYLNNIRSRPCYFNFKDGLERFLLKIPYIGKKIRDMIYRSKTALKYTLYKNTFFEQFGYAYLGPVDGHNIKSICDVLMRAKSLNRPVIVHVNTIKGKGYQPAENYPKEYHGVPSFDASKGLKTKTTNIHKTYTDVFSEEIVKLAKSNKKICAITAAMTDGVGLNVFSNEFPDRFFDVGIAEEHAIDFCCGLAKSGFIPVFAVYSSFLQRGYDQLINDARLNRLHIVLAIDRAGIVGEDGDTHHGIFDIAYLKTIPNTKLYAPSNPKELAMCLSRAVEIDDGICAVRYPKSQINNDNVDDSTCDFHFNLVPSSKKLVVCYGDTYNCVKKALIGNNDFSILKLVRLIPINTEAIKIALNFDSIYIIDESCEYGSLGDQFISCLIANFYKGDIYKKGITGSVPISSRKDSLKSLGFDEEGILNFLSKG